MILHAWKARITALLLLLATALMLGAGTVAAHGGHAHPDEGGFDATVLFQLGGAAFVVWLAYLVASAVYRRRDARHGPER